MLSMEQIELPVAGGRGLRGLDLEARAGEVLGLQGPSGAGKSLVLACVAGRVLETSGRVLWQGAPLSPAQRRDPRVCGWLDEGAGWSGPADLSAADLLRFRASLCGSPASAVDEMLEAFDLAEWAHTRVPLLPGGVRELLALAALELPRPTLLLLDHPLPHLDRAGWARLLAWRDRLVGRHATVLWAGAALPAARRLCDRIVWLEGGRASAEELRAQAPSELAPWDQQ